jgi:hypothetical protein
MTPRASATVWLGPVNLAQVGASVIPGAPATAVTCTGDGNPSCSAIAESWTGAGGRKLPSLLAQKGLPPDSVIAAAAFSAGGSILKRLCLAAADRAQLAVVHSADADYESSRGADGQPIPTEGYVLYALDALTDPDKLFVATASSNPNKTYGSGIDVLASTRREVERRSGRRFQLGGVLPGVTPQPAKLWRLGNVWMAEYPTIPHGQHATLLAPQVWQGVILPWLSGGGPGPDPGGGGGGPTEPEPPPPPMAAKGGLGWQHALAALAGALLGYGGVELYRRRARRA